MNEQRIVTLTDEEGNEIDFEVLDMIKFGGKEYAFLLPVAEGADDESNQEVLVTVFTSKGDDIEFALPDTQEETERAFAEFKKEKQRYLQFRRIKIQGRILSAPFLYLIYFYCAFFSTGPSPLFIFQSFSKSNPLKDALFVMSFSDSAATLAYGVPSPTAG